MIKAQHLLVVAAMVIIALLASLVTLLAVKSDPYAVIEPARAQGGMQTNDLVAVPFLLTASEHGICVIRKMNMKGLGAGAGMAEEYGMVIYQVENRRNLKVVAARRIQYDFTLSNYSLNPQDARSGGALNPRTLAERYRKGEDADDN